MRYSVLPAVLFLLAPLCARGASPDDIPLAPAVECTARAGLPNFFAKLEAGKEVRIGVPGRFDHGPGRLASENARLVPERAFPRPR